MVLNFFLVAVDERNENIRITPHASPKLVDAIPQLLESKRVAGRRPNYVASLERYLLRFAEDRKTVPISLVSVDDIEAWFAKRNETPSAKASNLGRIGALFSFAKRRGWVGENPVDRMEKSRIDYPPPRILTVAQVEKIMSAVKSEMPLVIPYLTLALFAGIRPEEISKLSWSVVDLNAGIVTINASASKTRSRRIVHLMPNAIEWLKLGGNLPPTMHRLRAMFDVMNAALGVEKFPRDCCRHSAASYLLAHLGDIGKVATELGNSVSILQKHYLELVQKSEAEKFWNIRP